MQTVFCNTLSKSQQNCSTSFFTAVSFVCQLCLVTSIGSTIRRDAITTHRNLPNFLVLPQRCSRAVARAMSNARQLTFALYRYCVQQYVGVSTAVYEGVSILFFVLRRELLHHEHSALSLVTSALGRWSFYGTNIPFELVGV